MINKEKEHVLSWIMTAFAADVMAFIFLFVANYYDFVSILDIIFSTTSLIVSLFSLWISMKNKIKSGKKPIVFSIFNIILSLTANIGFILIAI